MPRVFSSISITIFTIALAATALPRVASAQNPSPNAIDPATEKPDKALLDKLLAGEKEYWNAWKAKDWATVRKHMGTDGIWVDPLNVFSTEGFIKAVESGGMAFEIGPRAFLRKPTADTAVLVYDVKIGFGRAGAAAAQRPIGHGCCRAVFVNRGGQWVGISRSEVRGNRPPRPAAPPGQ